MSGFDGTGPQSKGPMTGGGRDFCAIPREEFDKGAFRRFGRGLRNRWGWRDKGF